MADSYLSYQNPTTTDKKLDSESLTVGANTVERERIQVSGTAATDIASVTSSTPPSTEPGLVVRNIPDGTQEVDGRVFVSMVDDGTISTVSTVASLTTGSVQLDPLSSITSIQNVDDGTISTVTTVSSLTTGSIQLDPLSHVTVQNIKAGTVDTVASLTAGSIQTVDGSRVYVTNVNDGTLSTLASLTTGSVQLDPLSHVTVQNIKAGTVDTVASLTAGSIQTVDGSRVYVYNVNDGTLSTVSSLTAGSVQLMASGASIGTVGVVPTLMYSTAGVITAAGTTLVLGQVSGKKIKVFAFDLSTTASAAYNEVSIVDGVTGGANLFVFGLVNATANCLCGITKAVTPPAYLFATSADSSLSILTSASEPVNYNISYWTADAV